MNNTEYKSIIIFLVGKLWPLTKSIAMIWYRIVNGTIFTIHGVNLARFPKIYGTLFVRNRGHLSIGSNVTITSGLSFSPIGGNTKTVLYVLKTGSLKIGNGVGISNACLFSAVDITVEDDVLIGGGVQIYDTDFHSVKFDARMRSENDCDVKSAPVLIKKGAFIGAHSIILKGVTVGENSVIGAGSVVTRDIPSSEIWAGNPATFIKMVS